MSDKPFEIRDSGMRENIGGGVRDSESGKTDYTLVLDGPMFDRWANHLTKAAQTKYGVRNWLNFFKTRESAQQAFDRAGRSLLRHVREYMRGNVDEDHAAAQIFNINVRETALLFYPDLQQVPSVETNLPVERHFTQEQLNQCRPLDDPPF
jgi:hypothetical protein